MHEVDNPAPQSPSRLETFATFFKRYMSVSAVVTAALPIPLTALGAIPTYQFQTKILSTYTSLFCFLILGFIFYSRHQLARAMFPEHFQRTSSLGHVMARVLTKLLPLLLIVGSISCAFNYQQLLINSIIRKRKAFDLETAPDSEILLKGFESETPETTWLMIYYLGIFMLAEAAFIFMAIKEYLQDLTNLSEIELIRGPADVKLAARRDGDAQTEKAVGTEAKEALVLAGRGGPEKAP